MGWTRTRLWTEGVRTCDPSSSHLERYCTSGNVTVPIGFPERRDTGGSGEGAPEQDRGTGARPWEHVSNAASPPQYRCILWVSHLRSYLAMVIGTG